MPLISHAPDKEGLFEFHMLCTGVRSKPDTQGALRYVLDLHDHNGSYEISIPESAMDHYIGTPPEPVRILAGDPERLDAPEVVRKVSIMGWAELDNVAALYPAAWCPAAARPQLQEFVRLIECMQLSEVRNFVNQVLREPDVRAHLLGAAASRQYHHAYPGGLLTHMMDGIPMLNRLCWIAGFSSKEFEISRVAYLFHDLGKILAGKSSVDHRAQTLNLLRPHLAQLCEESPAIGATLDHCMRHVCAPVGQRNYPGFVGATFVIWADQFSTVMQRGCRMEDYLRELQPALDDMTFGPSAA